MDLITILHLLQKIYPVIKPQVVNPNDAKGQEYIRLGSAPRASDFAKCIN
jgi:hypothetical protein